MLNINVNNITNDLVRLGSLVLCIPNEAYTCKKEDETKNAVNSYILGAGTALGNRDGSIDKPSKTQNSKYYSKYPFFHKYVFGSKFCKRYAIG